ncbi:MAG: hypothetical protein P4L79_10015 [Legionella sp.]|uniref:hypothetical protein n=1 Tax=Legionella sp. TaxID=459 RepID=UPI00283D4EC2|nr:hypothetical protein [Legionella sp.]
MSKDMTWVLVDKIRLQNWKQGGALVMDNDDAVELVEAAIAAAYERGRREENEACAKVAEHAVAAWESAWASGRDGGALDVGRAIHARIKKGKCDE